MILRPVFIQIFFLLTACFPSLVKATDSELWIFQHLAIDRAENHEVFVGLHARARESGTPSLYQIQPRFAFRLHQWLWLGSNYSFFGIRRTGDFARSEDLFSNQHRLEGEIQARLFLSKDIRYIARNRFEYLMNSSLDNINERFRHRSQFLLDSFSDGFGTLISQSEVFYDFQLSNFNQTRTVPLGLRISFESWSIQLQPMILHLRVPEKGWTSRFVANIELTYEF